MLEKRMVCEVPLTNTASKYDDATNRLVFGEATGNILFPQSPHLT